VVVDQGGVSIKLENGGRRTETSCESLDKAKQQLTMAAEEMLENKELLIKSALILKVTSFFYGHLMYM
jgi:hypothetical protein